MKTQNTLIGRSSGSIGGATATTWKGINVMKSKPMTVANPRTAGQLAQRAILKNLVFIYRLYAAFFNVGFRQQAIRKSAYNAFASENMKNGSLTGAAENKIAVPALFEASKGTLAGTTPTYVGAPGGSNSVEVNWDSTLSGNQLATDSAYLLVVKADGTPLGITSGTERRDDATSTVALDANMVTGQSYRVYLFFFQESTGKVSNSGSLAFTAS
jgi:hypothetical protein